MVCALGAAACGSSDGETSASPAAADDSAADAGSDGSLLDISAPGADGSTINLSDYAGQDLMLWFWAPW